MLGLWKCEVSSDAILLGHHIAWPYTMLVHTPWVTSLSGHTVKVIKTEPSPSATSIFSPFPAATSAKDSQAYLELLDDLEFASKLLFTRVP